MGIVKIVILEYIPQNINTCTHTLAQAKEINKRRTLRELEIRVPLSPSILNPLPQTPFHTKAYSYKHTGSHAYTPTKKGRWAGFAYFLSLRLSLFLYYFFFTFFHIFIFFSFSLSITLPHSLSFFHSSTRVRSSLPGKWTVPQSRRSSCHLDLDAFFQS